MKYSERVALVGAISSILVSVIPYFAVLFKLDDDIKTRIEQIVFVSIAVAVSLLTLFISRKYLRNRSRVQGFAWGYFYNFIYETSNLLIKRDANVDLSDKRLKTARGDKDDAPPGTVFSNEYSTDNIRILIIVPNNLYADYRLAELLSGMFADAVITPSKKTIFPIRRKVMRGFETKTEGQQTLLLIDTPPTTMRAIKMYQESCCDVSHNDPYEYLDKSAKKRFNQVYKDCRNFAPIFKEALEEIIVSLTKGKDSQEYRDLIRIVTLNQLTNGIINEDEYKKLNFIGDRISEESKAEKRRVTDMINKRKDALLRRLQDIAVG